MRASIILFCIYGLISVTAGHVKRQPAYLSANATALRRHALHLMNESPLIDTHMDLPQILRALEPRPLDAVDMLSTYIPGHADVPRMKQGHLGAAFMSVWAPCPDMLGWDVGKDFLTPTDSLRDTLEMFDLIQQMIQSSSDVASAYTSRDVQDNHRSGKLSFLLGIEGSHMLGNSLSTLRIFAQLGARYLTLTHTCHSAFASSAGTGVPLNPAHEKNGLSDIGRELIYELNRLGMMVDLSHVSDQTMEEALDLSRAPVIFSHSGARSIHSHPRNVPDGILHRIGSGEGQNRGVVLSVFYPPFIGSDDPDVADVADHIEHIASISGRAHVGIASDFDGMYASVKGLESVKEYPNLVMELIQRGWTDDEVKGAMGLNLLRVMDQVDEVKQQMSSEKPSRAVYSKRTDLPSQWGGAGDAYLPVEVRQVVQRRIRDEL